MRLCVLLAGRNTTNEELESMLESDNPAIFTSGVSDTAHAAWMNTEHTHVFNLILLLCNRFLPLYHLRSLWTTSPSKLWMRSRRGTMRLSSWKTASESFTTCSWTWPCWWRARWKHWCPLSIYSCVVWGSAKCTWEKKQTADAKFIQKFPLPTWMI